MTIKILPYKAGSVSAKSLADALGVKRLKMEGCRWKPKVNDVLINWGCSAENHPAFFGPHSVYNPPVSIQKASNKLIAFASMEAKGVEIPAYTSSKETAAEWLKEGLVVCRTILNGHSGNGIVIASKAEELVNAPLYTRYIKKDQEYRLHVVGGKVIFTQRKARKLDVPDDKVNWQVRNHQNGFIYANQNIEVSEAVKENAVKAVEALFLDFGAVDIITTKIGQHYVLEVNTAPGLSGTTLDKYVEVFSQLE